MRLGSVRDGAGTAARAAHALRSLLLLAALGLTDCTDPAGPAPRAFEVRAVWLEGDDADRGDMDRYFDCLLHRSNLADWWAGEAEVRYGGSFTVPPPPAPVGIADVAPFLAALPPPADPDAVPVDLVFAFGRHLDLDACAQLTTAARGPAAGYALIGLSPPCWPGTPPIRNATQLALQELVEVVDLLLGYAPCAGDGACQADGACPLGCDAFVGLACPGAPTGTATGCGGQVIDGWVVQRLSREGRDARNCLRCTTCDFVPASLPAP